MRDLSAVPGRTRVCWLVDAFARVEQSVSAQHEARMVLPVSNLLTVVWIENVVNMCGSD
jgi:hypothetical protein